MTEDYDLLIEQGVTEQVVKLRGRPRSAIKAFILSLAGNPHQSSQAQYTDQKGRVVELVTLFGWEITYHVDHPIKEVKALKIRKLT